MIKFADVIVDLQAGDTGKGKVAHALSKMGEYTHVVRYNGGGNAGHTIYHNGEKFVTHFIPCGVIHGIRSIIGPGCILDPVKLESEIQELEKELEEKQSLKIELDEELTIAREKMGDIAAIQKDISLRNQLEKAAQSASERAAEARRELSAWAFKVGPAIMLSGQLQKLQDEIDAAREKRVLPPDYKPDALIELLKSGSCICGRGLEKDSDACNHVEKLLAEFSDLSEIGSALSELQQPLQFLSGQIDSSPNTLKSTQERIKSAIKDEGEAMSQLNVIQQKLSSSDDSQVAFIANRHEDAKKSLEKVLIQVGSIERQLLDQKERLESVRKEIESEAATKEKSRLALQRQKFAETTLNAAKKMYEDFSNQVRAKVAQDLNEEFQSMVWKKDFFRPVEIDEDYRVLVYNKQGAEIRSLLSAGETACLAFAFSLTLSDVAGFSYPMVVDSPLGRLDKEVKEFVSGVLAKALESEADSEGKQILMLMTDSEYNKDVADALAHMKPKVLEIVFDQELSESKVVNAK
jgi:DNA sulfur modification protein DndD